MHGFGYYDACLVLSKMEHDMQLLAMESAVSTDERAAVSLHFGINRKTFLCSLPYFDVTFECVLHDPMHIILEGIAKIELQWFLLYVVDNGILSLSRLNHCLRNFEYSRIERSDCPQMIERKHLHSGGNLPQTATSMLVLLQVLPFVNGPHMTEDNRRWMNFLTFSLTSSINRHDQ